MHSGPLGQMSGAQAGRDRHVTGVTDAIEALETAPVFPPSVLRCLFRARGDHFR